MSTPKQRLRLAQSKTPKEQRQCANLNLQMQLIGGLETIPRGWALTPVDANKSPYRVSWQREFPLSREQLVQEIRRGALGYGIRTGSVSGGLLAIDFDGASAEAKLLELSGGAKLPETVAFTSGREGRSQHLFRVPQEDWAKIKSRKIATDTQDEYLELRWQGLQSVLPPSVHPLTGYYRWVRSPEEIEVAIAPGWLLALIRITPRIETMAQLAIPWADRERALSYLAALHPRRADDRDHWLKVGMALHSVDPGLLEVWERWSQQSPKYRAGECQAIWSKFREHRGITIATLGAFAKEDGWESSSAQPQGELTRLISAAYHPCLTEFRQWYFKARETGRSQVYLDRIQQLAEEFKAKTPVAAINPNLRNREFSLSVAAIAHLQEDAGNYRSRLEQLARDAKTILDYKGTEALFGDQPIRQYKSYTRGYTLRYIYGTKLITIEKSGKQILNERSGEIRPTPKSATADDFDCLSREVKRLRSTIV